MRTTFQRIFTTDGLEEHGLLFEPEKPTKKLILHVHGMAGNFYENKFLDYMAREYTKNKFAFMVFNNRGNGHITYFFTKSGGYKKIGNTFEIFEECIIDIKSWINYAINLGYDEIILQGHSLGCVKAVYYQWKEKDLRVKGIILLSPPDMLGLVIGDKKERSRWERLMKLSKELIKNGEGDEILPELVWDWYCLSAKTFVNFFDINSNLNIFPYYKPESGFKELREINLPILVFLGTKDDCVVTDHKKCLDILKKNSRNCLTYLIKDAPHSYRGHETELVKIVIQWLRKFGD